MIESDILKRIDQKFNDAIKENEAAIASGACNYNPHLAVRKKHEEVGLHSNFLYSILNPRGDHFRGSEFLHSFLKTINAIDEKKDKIDKFSDAIVTREKHKIDLLIETPDHWYIIENKIYAADQPSQINRYIHRIKTIEDTRRNNDASYEHRKISVIYLTLSGMKPSNKSLALFKNEKKEEISRLIVSTEGSIPLLLVSYKQIQAWCNQCLKQSYVNNSPALYYSIASYKQVLDRLLGKAAAGIPPLGGQCFPVMSHEDFFLSLTDTEKEEFIKASSDNCSYDFLKKSLIANGKIKSPRALLQSIFNNLLLRFRDSVYSEAAKHGFVIANARDGFKLNDVKLLETPINWYTQNVQRTGKHQFMAFKPRDADDNSDTEFWYVIYFAKHAFYHGFIKIKDNSLQQIKPEDLSSRSECLSLFKPYDWSPKDKLFVKPLGFAHYESDKFYRYDDDNFKHVDNYKEVMDILLKPKEFYKQIMEPTINAFWGKKDEGGHSTTKKLFLKND